MANETKVQTLRQWLENTLHVSLSTQNKLIATVLIFFILWLIRVVFIWILKDKFSHPRAYYHFQKSVGYMFFGLKILLMGPIWLEEFLSLATYLGLATAGIIMVMKDPIVNVVGWLTVVWKHPFEIGDRIEIDGVVGDVIGINLFEFSLLEIGNWVEGDQPTGRVVYLPNSKIFTYSQANYDRPLPFIWEDVGITITFDSDWLKAKEILEKAVSDVSHTYSKARLKSYSKKFCDMVCPDDQADGKVYINKKDYGIHFYLRYACDPRARRVTQDLLFEKIFMEFSRQKDIKFALPSQTLYLDRSKQFDLQEVPSSKQRPPRTVPTTVTH